MHLGLGLGLTSRGTGGGGVSGPRIALSASTIAEDADVGDAVGTFSVVNGSGSYTFTLTDDAGGLFDVDGADLEVGGALDYETAASHSITVEADNGVDTPISRILSITVTNVAETLPVNTVAPAITGTETEGETLTVSDGTWTGSPAPTYAYQWYRGMLFDGGGEPILDGGGEYIAELIVGATNSTYVLTVDDVGEQLVCEVTATNAAGSVTALSNETGVIAAAAVGADFLLLADGTSFLLLANGTDKLELAA